MTIQQAAKRAGISWVAMYVRYKKWPIEKLLIPATAKGRKDDGWTNVSEWA